jgi:hypothetical protein
MNVINNILEYLAVFWRRMKSKPRLWMTSVLLSIVFVCNSPPGMNSRVSNGEEPTNESSTVTEGGDQPTTEQVTEFLKNNPAFLEQYVLESVELEQLERWIIRRTQRSKKQAQPVGKNGRKTSLSR